MNYTQRHDFTKRVHLGKLAFCDISFTNNNLSICGELGTDSHGQVYDSIKEYLENLYAKGWTESRVDLFIKYWKEWHLNDLQPGCEHQRANWNDQNKIEVDGRMQYVGHVYPKVHKEGILCKPCEVCGYKYGSKWLRKEVPIKVLDWLYNLPDIN